MPILCNHGDDQMQTDVGAGSPRSLTRMSVCSGRSCSSVCDDGAGGAAAPNTLFPLNQCIDCGIVDTHIDDGATHVRRMASM